MTTMDSLWDDQSKEDDQHDEKEKDCYNNNPENSIQATIAGNVWNQ